jgi:hypothetical protein
MIAMTTSTELFWLSLGGILGLFILTAIHSFTMRTIRLETENVQLKFENEQAKQKAGLPLMLNDPMFQLYLPIPYEIKHVSYTIEKHCFIFVEFGPLKPWKIIFIDTSRDIAPSSNLSTPLKAGDYFVLWNENSNTDTKASLVRKIKLVPNPHREEELA